MQALEHFLVSNENVKYLSTSAITDSKWENFGLVIGIMTEEGLRFGCCKTGL